VTAVRHAFRIAIALAVPALCLYLALRGAEWAKIGEALASADYAWVAVMAAASILVLYVRAQRWKILLRHVGDIPMRPLFSATAIGFMANVVLPLRAGEVVRPYLLGRRASVSVSAAIASVVLERLFDMFLIFCFFLGLALVVPLQPGIRAAGYWAAAVATVALVILAVLLRNREAAVRRLEPLFRMLPGRVRPHAEQLLDNFLTGLEGINDRHTVLVLLGYSLYLWLVVAFTFACGLLALHLPVPVVAGSLTLVVVVAVFVSLPQAPGYVGTWQAGCVAALAFYKIAPEPAIGLSLLTQATQLLTVVGTGVVFLLLDNVRLVEVVHEARKEEMPCHEPRRRAGRRRPLRWHRLLQGRRAGAPPRAGRRRRPGRDDPQCAGVRHPAHAADAVGRPGGDRDVQPHAGIGDRPHPHRRHG
jgi:uncharacterized protein (TIRG00374 family)